MALYYYRNVRTSAKGRWYGKKLIDVAQELGNIRFVGDPYQVVGPKDFIEYTVHVHEPEVPLLQLPESIIFDSSEFMVINKPSGIPVHPTVNYYHNTVTELLKSKYGLLLPCYRLDRLTSGVLILGKTADFVRSFNKSQRSKEYFARVNASDLPQELIKQKVITVDKPIITYNGKRGYSKFLESVKAAKQAETSIELVGIEGELAMLSIKPVTGRTHQIRKHLSLCGMPIHNDPLYRDNGLFARLCEDPSQSNFEAIWDFAEEARKRKMTGTNCSDCGEPLYDRKLVTVDLHCGEYAFDGQHFRAAAPFQNQSS